MIYPFDQALIWHVIFHPGKAWWGRHYTHVSLAGFCDDTWLHLDLQRHGVHVATLYRHDEVNAYLSLLLHNYTVVRFGPSLAPSSTYFRPLTCVSFVKHVLGVRSGALRPDSLIRSLVADFDAQVLNDPETPEGNTRSGSAAHGGGVSQPESRPV
jgi:hypothetical protein